MLSKSILTEGTVKLSVYDECL